MKEILNPIQFYNDKKLLFINCIFLIIGTTLSVIMCATFESPIDLHFSDKMVPEKTIIGNTISTIALFLGIYISGIIINKKTRVVDCLNLALYLRIPFYLLSLINIYPLVSKQPSDSKLENGYILFENQVFDMIFIYSMVLLLFLFLIIPGIIMYRSFKTLSNAKKQTDYIILITILLSAIILSTLIIRNL